MAKKFLFVDDSGDYAQGGDTYEQADFVASSAGVADAGKPIKLDAGGLIDASMIDDSDIDHGSIGGLGDDDHSQYLLATGARSISGVIKYATDQSGSYDARSLVDKAYADAVAAGFGPKRSVRLATTAVLADSVYDNGTGGIGATLTNTGGTQLALSIDGVAVALGDRILVKDQTTTLQNGIYTVTAIGAVDADWELTRALDCDNSPDGEIRPGDYTAVEAGTDNGGYQYFQVDFTTGDAVGTDAVTYSIFSNPTDLSAGTGIDINANVVSVDSTDIINTAKGLTETTNVIEVKLEADGAIGFDGVNGGLEALVDGSTIEIATNALQVKADGINDTHINWGITGSQVSGVDIPIADAGGLFTTDNVEAALAQVMGDLNTLEGGSITGGNGVSTSGTLSSGVTVSADVDGATITATGGTGAQLAVLANGIDETHLDWGSTGNQINASQLPLLVGGVESYAGSALNVQDALEELEANMATSGITYTASGAIVKGDLVYVSGVDTVSTYDTITTAQVIIGVAQSSVADGEPVVVLANDTVLDGFTGLSAGTKYYWDGVNGWVTSFAGFSTGEYIWVGGVAKNATSIHIQTQFVMKKA